MKHKTKYKQLTEAYLHALGVITESTATWAAFLSSAAYTYEERFQSQVLLHHQRPGVKAVATLNQWDREKNRHIIRGSHGIPVFDAKHPECLTYVFDYQDTAGRSTPGLFPWTVYESKSGIARHNLLRRSGEKSLDSYVHTKVQQIVDTEVKSETSAAMRAELQKFLEQSAKYVVYTRLNMPVDDLDTSSFSFATQYQNRPKVLERLGTLLSHSLVACLSPVRDIAQAMHMTMPPPEELAVQKKDTKTRSVPETSEVTAESSPEAPREWGFYVIPDLKTWATNSSERTPIEHYETFEEARDRFASLRDQPYNKTNDLNDDGQPYAHLTLGLESKDKLSSVDILQVRAGQNYLVEDFTRMERLRADSVVLENLSRVAREIGFDRVRPYVMENGSYKALPDMPFSQWENPYFTVDSPEQGDTFTIYQLKGGSETRDYRFEPYESLQEAGLAIDRQNYDLVYTAPLDGKTTLEDIFRTFNLDRPPDFTGHSLSVSDIVVLNRGGDTKAYYCDSAGFVDVPSFLEQKMETAVDQPIINEDEIRRALCDGSNFEKGKMRIQYYFSQPVLPPREEMVRWLKKEYGTGGRSWDFANGSRGWLDYNNKGFEIQCNTDNGQISHTLTWQEVSSRLQELVQSNRYLTDAEYPEYEEWLSARQAEQDKRAADLEQAKEIIREYCTENGFDPPEFEDLRHIDLAYSSTGEGDHSINVYVDLLHHKIVYNVDGERILSAQYASTAELVEHELSGVTFDELIGTAEQEYQERNSLKATTTFGTKRKNFYEILRCSLNLQAVKVVDYIEDVDGKKKAVPNVKETRLAQDKQQQIETAFKDWIYRDPVRRRRLVDYYNTHYNNLRPREYDGSFLRFPGMSPEISLRPHQRNVVARILFGGNTLVAHAVGAGKTMVMGVAAMEKKRLGLCNKTLIIVPNHLTEQMGSELLSLYPNANILVSTRHDFEKNRRKLFCSRIATGNYDIVIMGHSQFSRIPLSSERQQKFLQDEIERYTQEIASAKKEKSGQDLSVKQMEATKKRLQSHLEELMDSPKDDVVTFEQLGVDSLMVDEAHEFKNLAVTTKMQNVAGISTSESQKATDLLMKTQYLDEITGERGLVFCTGTPISNSPVELYTMMRYLQASTLRAHDLLSFDAWAANFGQTTTSIELAPEGTGYRSKTRFSRFFNLPELISMWKLATDVQTSDMLNLQVPDLEGGKATAVMCPPTELQKESIQALGERAEKVRAGNVDPHTDNMLKITTDGRKLALDQRLLNPLLPDVPENKATACASKVFEIWQNTMATQSTQLIFSDLATPSTGEWNVYDDIRDKLIAKGIPKEQIAFIHDANTDAKKATLFAKVRAGKVRILMGSTQKMGAGTNVQTKLIALHHLDVPWRPSDIEQREGRILRQGNENPSVQIYRYATEGSFDAYSWQLIENKQKFISQIMTSKSPARSCQDLDEVALSYAEIKALCAGNPLIKEKMELDNEVARLSTLRSSHMSQIFELQDKIAIGYPASIQKVEESLDAVSKDIDVYKANSRFNPDGSEKFSAIVMGTTYTERKAADAALRDALQGATAGDVIIGQYRGFNIHAYYDAKAVSFMGYLQGEQKYNFEFNPKENFSSFRHLLEKLSDTQALDQERLTILNKNLEDAKEAVNQPFAYEKEFQTKLARLNELNTILNQEGGKTDVHPEIQELQAKIDQTYAAMAADPQKYLEYLNFRGQCVGMGVENSVAVFAQNPKATYCPSPEAIGSPKVKPGEEDRSISVLRTDGIERVYALEQYDLPESEYLDKAPLQWTEAQHSDLIHRVEDAAQLADISVLSDLRHGTGFFDASRNVIHIREGNNSTEQLKSLLEGYSEAVITRTSTSDKPVAELESAALTALLQVRCGVPIDDQLAERITAALEDAGNVGGFSMRDSVARLHNAMEYCVRYAELEQTSEQYQAQQIEPEELTPQSEAFMEMM